MSHFIENKPHHLTRNSSIFRKSTAGEDIKKIQVESKESHIENEQLLNYDVNYSKEYLLEKSTSSFKFERLEGFVFGPITSRFWMLRKHILLMNKTKIEQEAPFFAWECITLQVQGRPDIYLIIRDENIMLMFLKFLIYKLKTIDG